MSDMYPDDRVRVLESDMRIVLDLPTLRAEPWRTGTDFFADLAHDGDQLLGVVRSPRVEQASTSYDGVVDFAAVLAKEAVAAELLAAAGVPVPRVLRLGRAWCLAELVESDVDFPTALVLPELGRLTRTIHTIRPDTAGLRPQRSWSAFFTQRLGQRLTAAARYTKVPVDFRVAVLRLVV